MIPYFARQLLRNIPVNFADDGCSKSPDWNFKWACRIHDWWYCTRAHPEGQMTEEWRAMGDHVVRELIRSALPSGLKWIGGVYFRVLRVFGGHAFNSCGPDPDGALPFQRLMGWCRHGLPKPDWMWTPVYPVRVVDVNREARTITVETVGGTTDEPTDASRR